MLDHVTDLSSLLKRPDLLIERGSYEPPIDPETLAYVLVRLAESALFHYDTDEYPRDLARMREVQAALLGV